LAITGPPQISPPRKSFGAFTPPVRRDLPDLRREHVFGGFEIEACPNVHPERSVGLEEFAEPQRGVGNNA